MRTKEQTTEKYRELTKGELQIMNVLWDKRHATVGDVRDALPEPRPAYNTVLTFLRILTEKEYVGYEPQGRFYVYHPLVQKGEYTRAFLKEIKERLFDGSAKSLLSFFVNEENLSAGDVQELLDMLEKLK